MVYVFDASSFIVLGHYFPERFPSFWRNLGDFVSQGKVISVKEVYNELSRKAGKLHLQEWVKANRGLFIPPSKDETLFVSQIFSVPHFQQLVGQKQTLKGTPVADPFVVASAKIRKGCVVTEEEERPNAAKIPNVCKYFEVECANLEGFMEREGWRF